MICQLVVNPQTGKPLDERTLKKHFPREIAVGAAEGCTPGWGASPAALSVTAPSRYPAALPRTGARLPAVRTAARQPGIFSRGRAGSSPRRSR